ncbi:MAG: ATP-binding protein [Pseudonocardiaceae bacterium]|nr:ATP-binding protein [Pseudonocardiaceae bacterium]
MDDNRGTGRPPGDARPPLRVEEIATARSAARLRQQCHDWLILDVPSSVVDDLLLVVYEALANAAEHAYVDHTDGPGPLRLEARRTDGHILITVSDEGSWRAPTGDRFRGRGLPLMRHLAQDVRVASGHDGTVVALRLCLESAGEPSGECLGDL